MSRDMQLGHSRISTGAGFAVLQSRGRDPSGYNSVRCTAPNLAQPRGTGGTFATVPLSARAHEYQQIAVVRVCWRALVKRALCGL